MMPNVSQNECERKNDQTKGSEWKFSQGVCPRNDAEAKLMMDDEWEGHKWTFDDFGNIHRNNVAECRIGYESIKDETECYDAAKAFFNIEEIGDKRVTLLGEDYAKNYTDGCFIFTRQARPGQSETKNSLYLNNGEKANEEKKKYTNVYKFCKIKGGGPPAPVPPIAPFLPLDIVKEAVKFLIESNFRIQDVVVSIAVVDQGGHLMYITRMDGVSAGSIDLALRKARTAALFGKNSEDMSQPEGGQCGLAQSNGGLLTMAGGVPVVIDPTEEMPHTDGQEDPWATGAPAPRSPQMLGAVGVAGAMKRMGTTVAEEEKQMARKIADDIVRRMQDAAMQEPRGRIDTIVN